MRETIRIMSILLSSLFLTGCDAGISNNKKVNAEQDMFTKRAAENYVIFSPMDGVLVRNGVPLPNTKIIRRLQWNGNDEGLTETFITDDQGRFSLPIHEEELSLGMLNQFVGKADLELDTTDGKNYLWTSSKFFPEVFAETEGKVDELVCDIESEEIAVPMGPTSILTKCRWENMPE